MSDLVASTLAAAALRHATTTRASLRAHGVVATPREVVLHAVTRVDALLREELAIEEGLSSRRVVVVDPAVGTGVWLAALLEYTRARYGHAAVQLHGFDVDAQALETVRALLAPAARAQGASLTLRCANTLELESAFAVDEQVRVVLGNPPWAARSLSRGGPRSDAMLAEFRVDGAGRPLGERRVGVLSDDYVRFFRWALEQAREARHGALICFASNGSYLDGPVHRGMRAALVGAFDRIDVLDLGGNSLLSREGQRDDNLFGVRVGAALCWAVRRAHTRERHALVSYGALLGSRRDKLAALAAATPSACTQATPSACTHVPQAPWYRFRPPHAVAEVEGFSLAEAFPFHREGVQTNRDALAIAGTREELAERLWRIARGELALPSSGHFDPVRARILLRDALEGAEPPIAQLAYRPLDDRFVVTLAPLCHRPRPELAQAVAHSPSCLLAVRKERGAAAFNLFAPARLLADGCYLSTRSSCRTRVFPSHTPAGDQNLSPAISDALSARLGEAVASETLIAYVLGVLGAPRYRARNEQALKLDYARVPWPRDGASFAETVRVGKLFERALAARPVPGEAAPCVVASSVPAEQPLSLSALHYRSDERRLLFRHEVLLSELEPAVWQVRVGHVSLVESALSAPGIATLSRLLAALSSAERWLGAERAADAIAGT